MTNARARAITYLAETAIRKELAGLSGLLDFARNQLRRYDSATSDSEREAHAEASMTLRGIRATLTYVSDQALSIRGGGE